MRKFLRPTAASVLVAVAALLLFGAVATQAVIYSANGTAIQQINDDGSLATVVDATAFPDAIWQALVVSPDETAGALDYEQLPHLIFACSLDGRVIRIDPAGPTSNLVATVGQCNDLTLSYHGDLLITSTPLDATCDSSAGAENDTIMWRIENATSGGTVATSLFDTCHFGGGALAGVDVCRDGSLRVIDSADGELWWVPFDTGRDFFDPIPYASNLTGAFGVACFEDDRVWVTESNNLKIFRPNGTTRTCSAFGRRETPINLSSTSFVRSSGQSTGTHVYLATTSNNAGKVYEIASDCSTSEEIASFRRRDGFDPQASAAVHSPVELSLDSGSFSGDYLFNFAETHFFEIGDALGCNFTATHWPVSRATMTEYIGDIATDLSDPDDPADFQDTIFPVPPFSGGGFFWMTDLEPTNASCTFAGDGFSFSDTLLEDRRFKSNPRLGKLSNLPCGTDLEDECVITPLVSFIDENPLLGGDGRRSGTGDRTSLFASLNKDTSADQNQNAGAWAPGDLCGFEPPLTNATSANDPGLKTYSANQTIGIKTALRQVATGGCPDGDRVLGARILVSIWRVQDSAGNDAFNPVIPEVINPCEGLPVMCSSGGTRDGNYNVQFKMPDDAPFGTYALKLVALTDNFEATDPFAKTYFRYLP